MQKPSNKFLTSSQSSSEIFQRFDKPRKEEDKRQGTMKSQYPLTKPGQFAFSNGTIKGPCGPGLSIRDPPAPPPTCEVPIDDYDGTLGNNTAHLQRCCGNSPIATYPWRLGPEHCYAYCNVSSNAEARNVMECLVDKGIFTGCIFDSSAHHVSRVSKVPVMLMLLLILASICGDSL